MSAKVRYCGPVSWVSFAGGSEGSFSFLAANNVVVVYFASWRARSPLLGLSRALYDALPEGPDRDELFRVPEPFSVSLVQDIVTRFDADLYLLLDQLEELELYQRGLTGDNFAGELGTATTHRHFVSVCFSGSVKTPWPS